MSSNNNGGEGFSLPVFPMPTAELPVAIHDGSGVTPDEAVKGLERALVLGEGDRIERCYVANRRGHNPCMLIGSVVVEASGFKRDTKIEVNDELRHPLMGEAAITWFGSIAGEYDHGEYVSFMRGHGKIVVAEQVEAVA